MLPIILVLGATGALLEIKRLIARPPKDGDLLRLRQSEEQLKRVLQEVQQELQQERSEHQLDQSKIDELERADLELKRVHADLMAHKELELRQRTLEFTQLSDKVEEMQVIHEEACRLQNLKFEAEVENLKADIASAFACFSEGQIGAKDLLENVSKMGVDVQLTPEELESAITSAHAITNGKREVKKLQLQVDSEWRSQLRLLSDDPERMAMQLAAGARRAALPAAGPGATNFPTVKTPKEWKEASIFAHMPSLSLPNFSSPAAINKENVPESSKRTALKEAGKEPLQAVPSPDNHTTPKMIPIEGRKVASPVKARRKPTVPRLGLAVALSKTPASDSNRDVFALGDFSHDDDEHRMLNRSVL